MIEENFARQLLANNIKKQVVEIMEKLKEAQKRNNGDVSIIYEGTIPKELIEYLLNKNLIEVNIIETRGTKFAGKTMYYIYPNAKLDENEINEAIVCKKNFYIGGSYMDDEFAKNLMLNSITKQINNIVEELANLVRKKEGKGSVLHEGMILPQVKQILARQGIKIEEIDTTATDEIEKRLYSIYPDVHIPEGMPRLPEEELTQKKIDGLILDEEFGSYIKQRLIPIQKNRIIYGLLKKINNRDGDISIAYEGKIFDEVIKYMKRQGISIEEVNTTKSNKVGEHIYQIMPNVQFNKSMVEDAIIEGEFNDTSLPKERIIELLKNEALGTFLKEISVKRQMEAIQKELEEAGKNGKIESLHFGVIYPEIIELYKEMAIKIEKVDFSKTSRVGQIAYQVYPYAELSKEEVEDAIIYGNTEDGHETR